MPTAKVKPTTNGNVAKKDLSALYGKSSTPRTLPIQAPQLNIDVELEFKVPDDEVKAWLDMYVVQVTRSVLGNTVLTDEQLLQEGTKRIVSLAAYLRKVALLYQAEQAREQVSEVKNAELVALRDRMTTLTKDLEYALQPDYEEKESLTFHMSSNEAALNILYRCISKCFPELENPATLTTQIKYILALALLGAAGKTIVV